MSGRHALTQMCQVILVRILYLLLITVRKYDEMLWQRPWWSRGFLFTVDPIHIFLVSNPIATPALMVAAVDVIMPGELKASTCLPYALSMVRCTSLTLCLPLNSENIARQDVAKPKRFKR